MVVSTLADLPAEPTRAVIINVNTKLVSTLALLSALRHAAMPVLLVDCESKRPDGSLDYFVSLMRRYAFDLVSAPLRLHGHTLDWIFRDIRAERVLLIDSDVEIHRGEIVAWFKEYIDDPTVFGCGFVNGPGWLRGPEFQRMGLEGALFHERMWMPLTMLKTEPVREALRAEKSFVSVRRDNEYTLVPILARLRARYPRLRRMLLHGPAMLRRPVHGDGGVPPALVCYDTGAQVYDYLRYDRLLHFVGLPEPVHPRFVTHFFGVTRNLLHPTDTHGGGGLAKIEDHVRRRLVEIYGEGLP